MIRKIVNFIPINVRNMVPQKIRNAFNCRCNYLNILSQKFKFRLKRKRMIEDKYKRAINLEYDKYCDYMKWKDKEALKLPDEVDSLILPRLVLSVTNKCSLRCKDCNNLIPYFQNKRDIPVESIITNIDKIFSIVDCCINVEIIGGEPFLYKNLGIVLKHLVQLPQVYSVEITTNGTVIPTDEVVEVLKNDKIYVSLSNYEAVNEEKKMNFKKCMKENAVKIQILDMGNWIDSGNVEKRNRNRNELRWQYYKCYSSMNCKTFWDGKLFACGRAPALYELCSLTDESSYFDFENISTEEERNLIKKNLKEFYLSDYAECCDYCDYAVYPMKIIKGGVQL